MSASAALCCATETAIIILLGELESHVLLIPKNGMFGFFSDLMKNGG